MAPFRVAAHRPAAGRGAARHPAAAGRARRAHPAPARWHRCAHRGRPGRPRPVSHQAVYDVLHTLARGWVRRIQPAGSVARYELRVGDNRRHMVCRSCGVVVDIDCGAQRRVWTPRNSTCEPRVRAARGRGHLLGDVRGVRGIRAQSRPELTASPRTEPSAPRRRGPAVPDQPESSPSDVTANGSDSENPVIDAPTAKPGGRTRTRTGGRRPSSTSRSYTGASRRATAGCRTSGTPTPSQPCRGAEARRHRGHDDLAGLVAGWLGPPARSSSG